MRMKSVNSQRTPVTQVQVTIDIEKTGEQLKIITKEKGYEVRDLVALTGYSSQAVYKWFNGKSLPSIDTLVVLSKVLNMEINELLVIDGEFDFFGKSPRRLLLTGLLRLLHCSSAVSWLLICGFWTVDLRFLDCSSAG